MLTKTKFPKSVKQPNGKMLKSAAGNAKLGAGKKVISIGKWKGMPMYYLTLEERATCPTSCHHWEDCYGNNMPFAHRFDVHTEYDHFERHLYNELYNLDRKHPRGFVVRLHVLGDFFSVRYVNFWQYALLDFPALHVFGYSARDYSEPIGVALYWNGVRFKDRWKVRVSKNLPYNKAMQEMYAATEAFEGKAFQCPEQVGKVSSCVDCGLCWTTNKTVIFKTH